MFIASYAVSLQAGKYYLEIKGTPVDAPLIKLYYCYIAIVNHNQLNIEN